MVGENEQRRLLPGLTIILVISRHCFFPLFVLCMRQVRNLNIQLPHDRDSPCGDRDMSIGHKRNATFPLAAPDGETWSISCFREKACSKFWPRCSVFFQKFQTTDDGRECLAANQSQQGNLHVYFGQ